MLPNVKGESFSPSGWLQKVVNLLRAKLLLLRISLGMQQALLGERLPQEDRSPDDARMSFPELGLLAIELQMLHH